jgi:N-acetyltransferase
VWAFAVADAAGPGGDDAYLDGTGRGARYRRVMAQVLPPFALEGRHVRLEPLRMEHVDDLVRAASADRSTYGFTKVPIDDEEMTAYVATHVADRDAGRVVPFVQRRLATGDLVGCTRFMDMAWWRGRDAPDEVEIGGTWLTADAQRTAVNTEAKRLLLAHAFEVWGVVRVAICTDARNERSRTAIARLGATFEGVLRNHRPVQLGGATGTPQPRDTAVYSIVDREWPAIRQALDARLAVRS